jgi:hypothetical protein
MDILGLPDSNEMEYHPSFKEVISVYLDDDRRGSVEWLIGENETVFNDQYIANVGPFKFRKGIKYVREAIEHASSEHVDSIPDKNEFHLKVRAPQSGHLSAQSASNGMTLGKLTSNRRIEYAERFYEPQTPLKHLADYLAMIVEYVQKCRTDVRRAREEEKRRLEQQKLDMESAERRKLEEVEAARLERERQKRLEQERLERQKRLEAEGVLARRQAKKEWIQKARDRQNIKKMLHGAVVYLAAFSALLGAANFGYDSRTGTIAFFLFLGAAMPAVFYSFSLSPEKKKLLKKIVSYAP